MRKGAFGFELWFYGIIALFCVWIEQPLLLACITGFVMFLERDDWLNHQMLSIFCFLILFLVLREGIITIFSVSSIMPGIDISVANSLKTLTYFVLDIIKFVIVIMSYGKMKNGKSVEFPIASAIIRKIYT
ncbi:MAG: hypothetical protein HFE57_05360 [Firmicutes bacterium]|jgi:uncharacterized Tic20 family protein|nr:hypothetical protein [Bacillota bacterium]